MTRNDALTLAVAEITVLAWQATRPASPALRRAVAEVASAELARAQERETVVGG